MRGRDQADVDLPFAHVAEPPEFLLFQDLQELRLDGERNIPDLVEEERSPVRDFEEAELRGDRTGEGPLPVAEELALQELRRKAGAIQVQEALVASRSVAMDPGGEDAFPGARLTMDENRDVGSGDALRPIREDTHRGARAAEGIEMLPCSTGFVPEPAAAIALILQNPIDHEKQGRELNRLGQELLRPFLDRLSGDVQVFISGENDAGNAGVRSFHVGENVEGGAVGQARGDNESVRPRGLEGLESDAAGRRLRRLVPVDLKHSLEILADRDIRIDDQDPPFRLRR